VCACGGWPGRCAEAYRTRRLTEGRAFRKSDRVRCLQFVQVASPCLLGWLATQAVAFPACQTRIYHSLNEDRPRLGMRYRPHICRLELVLDPKTDRLTLVPFEELSDVRDRPTN
jgi:hypothetical protein